MLLWQTQHTDCTSFAILILLAAACTAVRAAGCAAVFAATLACSNSNDCPCSAAVRSTFFSTAVCTCYVGTNLVQMRASDCNVYLTYTFSGQGSAMHPHLDLLQQLHTLLPQAADTALEHSLLIPDSSNLHRPVLRRTPLRVHGVVTCNDHLTRNCMSSRCILLLTRLPVAAGPPAAPFSCWHAIFSPPAIWSWRAASSSAASPAGMCLRT